MGCPMFPFPSVSPFLHKQLAGTGRKYMIGILSCLCFVECCCLFIFKACSGLNRKCSLSELSAPHLLNHRRNLLTLYYLQISLSSHISRIHQNLVFTGHQHHCVQTGWQGTAADRYTVCISPAPVTFLSSHQPSLTKHMCREEVINNFKTATTKL